MTPGQMSLIKYTDSLTYLTNFILKVYTLQVHLALFYWLKFSYSRHETYFTTFQPYPKEIIPPRYLVLGVKIKCSRPYYQTILVLW